MDHNVRTRLGRVGIFIMFLIPSQNNDIGYEVVIRGLSLVARPGVSSIEICCIFQLIVRQLTGKFETRDKKMTAYLMKVKDLQRGFPSFNIAKVYWKDKERSDALARLTSASPKNLLRTTNIQVLR